IVLEHFKENSLQGDSILTQIYQDLFGVKTTFLESHQIKLENINDFVYPKRISLNMNDCPDIAQTLCVTATAFGIPFEISGLSTLKVKETDRLVALQNELQKIGCKTEITQDSIKSIAFHEPDEHIVIKTYNDHRMAMSFAPFALIKDLEIENPEVVEKSYPDFWKDFRSVISL
ncbi:MAG: 3-phosphoshikimate 1-carboxyvinyltransferase, partial [Bergeyella zoohelcum]|nr:3-phosphoshikimate 1-carboxyvinyltransferase [Bergeyella zoohelcum]